MPLSNDTILSNILQNELKGDEKIVWEGRPTPMGFFKKGVKIFWIFAVVIVLLAIPAIHHASSLDDFITHHTFLLALLVGFIVCIWSLWQRAKKYFYILTDKRALVICTYRKVKVCSFYKDKIINYNKIYNADGSGDIIFEGEGGRVAAINRSFICIPNVKRVADLIDEMKKVPA